MSRSQTLGDIPIDTTNQQSLIAVDLGRRLFYDPNLSSNKEVSCASCHDQKRAFSDGLKLSRLGVSGFALNRHTPVLQNLAWHKGFFWDGGANDLESQALGPLTHRDEMNADISDLINYLNNTSPYPVLFKEAFNDSISLPYIQRALAQFQKTLISDNSRYDKFLRGELNLNDLETKGLTIFESKCERCHQFPFFSDHDYHNNGLDSLYESEDIEDPLLGRFRITQESTDLLKYKTPSLRNVMVTAPYMHDGRFASIDDVLAFYDQHRISTNTTDTVLASKNFGLPKMEKEAIKAFLKTLTDSTFLTNPKYAAP